MSRLIVAARRRPEIDISKFFGDYEFLVVPNSLFHDNGKLVLITRVRKLVPRNKFGKFN